MGGDPHRPRSQTGTHRYQRAQVRLWRQPPAPELKLHGHGERGSAHEAEILSSNALQATGHVGAEPSPLSDLMGDFLDPIQIKVPPVRPPERPQTQADASMAPPAELAGEKRPAPDDGMGDKRQDLHDEPEPIELEFADPTRLTFPDQPMLEPAETSVAFPVESEDRPMLESREESAAFPMPSEPTRTLESREASAAAPLPTLLAW